MRWTDLRLLSPLFLSLVIIGWEKLDYRCNYLCSEAQSMGLDQCIKLVRFRSKGESYIVMEINLSNIKLYANTQRSFFTI